MFYFAFETRKRKSNIAKTSGNYKGFGKKTSYSIG